jgi:large subunit ribosomal protein L17
MRHNIAGRKLGRSYAQRQALFRTLVTQLLDHGKIRITEAKAKAIRGQAEHMITLAKKGDLHSRRLAASKLNDPKVVQKLFEEIGPKYEKRAGGYTRILKLGTRQGDGAPIVLLELVEE